MTLSHLDETGRPRMVDVGTKPASERTATAEGVVKLGREAFEQVAAGSGSKGNILTTAELAGTMAAKRTSELIPLCHPVALDHIEVRATMDQELPGVRVRAVVKATGKTGVEMEALTAVSVALLTVYDMTKAAGHGMELRDIRLLEKRGGTRGAWVRAEPPK